jgi:hypothetical protein
MLSALHVQCNQTQRISTPAMHPARDTERARPDTPAVSSRRGPLGGGTAALLIGAAAVTAVRAEPPDADLVRLLAKFRDDNATVLAVEEEGYHLPPGITADSEGRERDRNNGCSGRVRRSAGGRRSPHARYADCRSKPRR